VFVLVFALGAGLAGMAGVVGGTFQSISPGEDIRFLLASLVVVIIGGMGSIPGAAAGAIIVGLAEQLGSVYIPTYAIVVTFLIMVLVLAVRRRPAGGPLAIVDHARRATAARTRRGDVLDRSRWRGFRSSRRLGCRLLPDRHAAHRQRLFPHRDFGTTLILGIVALSLMFLAGYGGMVSLMQLTIAGLAGYMTAVLGASGNANISLGWPWWLATPMAARPGDAVSAPSAGARGAHRGHLHDHDHAGDCVGFLLLHQPELGHFQRPHRHQQRRHAAFLGVDWRAMSRSIM